MTELSLKQRIERYVKKSNRPVSGGEIERLVSENTNYKPSNASRRCRELVDEGVLKANYREGTVFYMWNTGQFTMSDNDRAVAMFDSIE